MAMSESVSAAIHIQGTVIRYAELVWKGATPSLHRHGHRAFEFDLPRVLRDETGSATALDRVEAAIEEELGETEASEVCLVVSPLAAFSFFTPISSGLSERDRMRRVVQQAALVTGIRSPDSLRITPRVVRTVEVEGEEPVDWIHVLAEPKTVNERMEALAASVPAQECVQMVSSEAAARLVGHVEAEKGPSSEPSNARGPFSLAVGQYSSHTEYTLTHNHTWYHAHASQDVQRPENRAYFAVSFLNRIDVSPRDVGCLYLYGNDVDRGEHGPLEAVFDHEVELLDPFQILGESLKQSGGGATGSYAPCVGAALNDSDSH